MSVTSEPSQSFVAIVPGSPIIGTIRGIYVGTGGNITGTGQDGSPIVFKNLSSGAVYPFCLNTIEVSGTTASDLVGLY
jgi:hypothetical protein